MKLWKPAGVLLVLGAGIGLLVAVARGPSEAADSRATAADAEDSAAGPGDATVHQRRRAPGIDPAAQPGSPEETAETIRRLHYERSRHFGLDLPPPPSPDAVKTEPVPIPAQTNDLDPEFELKMTARMLDHQKQRLARVEQRIEEAHRSGDATAVRTQQAIAVRLRKEVEELEARHAGLQEMRDDAAVGRISAP